MSLVEGRASFEVGPFTEPGEVTLRASYAGNGSVRAGQGDVVVRVRPQPVPGDTTAPDTSLLRGPEGAVRRPAATFTFVSSEPGSTFTCSLDGAAWEPCRSPATVTGLGQGEHEMRVRATDAAGNTDASPAVRTWTVDRGRPTVEVVAGSTTTRDRTPTVRLRIDDRHDRLRASDVRVRFGARAAASVRVTRSGRLVATARQLAPGRHRVVVTVRDEAGNRRTVRWWVTVVR